MWCKMRRKYWQAEPTAGSSTAPLAMKLQEAPLRMTLSIFYIDRSLTLEDTFQIKQSLTFRVLGKTWVQNVVF